MTTRPEFGVPHPCYSGAVCCPALLALLITLGLAEALKAPRLQMLVSHTPVTQGQRAV